MRAISIEILAGRSGVTAGTINDIRKYLPDPKLMTVLRFCRGLEVTPGELLDGLPLPEAPRETRGARRNPRGTIL